MNTANKITFVRLLLIPVFLLFTSRDFTNLLSIPIDTSMLVAAGIFLVAALTDKLDGYVARTYNQVTKLGILLDPLVDKLLISSALIVLVEHHLAGSWAAVIIIAREFMITLLRIAASRRSRIISADRFGKAKLVMQVAAVMLLLLKDIPFQLLADAPYGQIALAAATLLTLYSGLNYMLKNKHVFAG